MKLKVLEENQVLELRRITLYIIDSKICVSVVTMIDAQLNSE